jgi:hypothetical protein
MTKLRQRRPRIAEPAYLAWLRQQACACGCGSPPPSDAAHLRASSLKYDKDFTGGGRKPDDKWAMPLNHACHMRQHAYGSEVGWWSAHGVPDPFGRSMRYYAAYTAEAFANAGKRHSDASEPRKRRKAKPGRKPHPRPPAVARGPKKRIPSPANPWPVGRKIRNRGFDGRNNRD